MCCTVLYCSLYWRGEGEERRGGRIALYEEWALSLERLDADAGWLAVVVVVVVNNVVGRWLGCSCE